MTKMSFRNQFRNLGLAVLVICLFVPSLLFAKTSPSASSALGFCSGINALALKLEQRMTNRFGKIEEKRTDAMTNLEERQQKRDERQEQNRQRFDQNRAEFLAKLEARAQTDAQKAALAKFKAAVTEAIKAHRAAIDSAKSAFRQGVEQAIASRKSAVNLATKAYQDAVKAALAKAKADCKAGVEPAAVREELHRALKVARDKFETDRQAIEKLKDSLKPLIEARKAAIAKANQDFQTAIEKARTELKAALGGT